MPTMRWCLGFRELKKSRRSSPTVLIAISAKRGARSRSSKYWAAIPFSTSDPSPSRRRVLRRRPPRHGGRKWIPDLEVAAAGTATAIRPQARVRRARCAIAWRNFSGRAACLPWTERYARITTVLEHGLQQPGDVEARLGLHLGQMADIKEA